MSGKRKKKIYKKSRYYRQQQLKRRILLIAFSIVAVLLIILGIRSCSSKQKAQEAGSSSVQNDVLTEEGTQSANTSSQE